MCDRERKEGNRYIMKLMKRITGALLAVLLTVSCGTMHAQAAEKSSDRVLSQMRQLVLQDAVKNAEEQPAIAEDAIVELIVELKGASGVELSPAQSAAETAEDQTLMEQVKRSQEKCIQSIMEIDKDALILHRYGLLVNGFSVRTRYSSKAKIEKLPGVASVVMANQYDRAVTETAALGAAVQTAQQSKFDGRGTVVAVVDSGIDYTHKDMVLSPGVAGKLSKEDVSAIQSGNPQLKGRYFTEKVPYGYNYADQNSSVIDTAVEDPAYNHGMHVAGIIGANCQSQAEINAYNGVRGAAPECQMLAMKIFSNTANVSASEADIIAAIEDSVALGADVINLSIGLSAGFHNSENGQQKAIKAAREAGVIVVAAAGNGAYAPYQQASDTKPHPNYSRVVDTGTIAEPGLSEDTIQVASRDNSARVVWQLSASLNGKKQGSFPYVLNDLDTSALTGSYPVVDCGLGTAAEMNGKDLSGKIALIQRGNIEFAEKKRNAQEHGALAVILYNSAGNETFLDYTSSDKELNIPALFLRHSDGTKLRSLASSGASVTFDASPVSLSLPFSGMSYFSSRGPASDLTFKPDVTAVGGYVWSTIGGNGYQTMSGTSMACPNVAGMAALMVQQLNERGADVEDPTAYVKAALMNTACPMADENGALYSPRAQGAGAADLSAALENTATAAVDGKPYIALGEMSGSRTVTVQLHNNGSEELLYSVSAEGTSASSVRFGAETISVQPGASASLSVTISAAGNTNSFVEGFLRFKPLSGSRNALSLPYMGFYGDWGSMQVMDDPLYEQEKTVYGQTGLYTVVNMGLVSQLVPLGDGESADYCAINPSDKSSYCNAMPEVSFLRNARNVTVDVTDESGKVLRVLDQQDYVRKEVPIEQSILAEVNWNWIWHGTNYNKVTGRSESLPEGQYYVNVRACADAKNAKQQLLTLPVKIDQTVPTVSATPVFTQGSTFQIEISAKDLGVVDSGIKNFVFLLDGDAYRDAEGNAVFRLEPGDSGSYLMTFRISDSNTNAVHTVDIGVTDYANNMGAARVYVFDTKESKMQVTADKQTYAPGESIGLRCTWSDSALGAKAEKYQVYAENFTELLGTMDGPEGRVAAMLPTGSWRIIVQALDGSGKVLDTNFTLVRVDGEQADESLFFKQTTSGEYLENGKSFSASIRAANLGDSGASAALILALYDGDMRMVDCVSVERSIAAGKTETLSATLSVPASGRYSAKIMVWNNLSDMESLTPCTWVSMS